MHLMFLGLKNLNLCSKEHFTSFLISHLCVFILRHHIVLIFMFSSNILIVHVDCVYLLAFLALRTRSEGILCGGWILTLCFGAAAVNTLFGNGVCKILHNMRKNSTHVVDWWLKVGRKSGAAVAGGDWPTTGAEIRVIGRRLRLRNWAKPSYSLPWLALSFLHVPWQRAMFSLASGGARLKSSQRIYAVAANICDNFQRARKKCERPEGEWCKRQIYSITLWPSQNGALCILLVNLQSGVSANFGPWPSRRPRTPAVPDF